MSTPSQPDPRIDQAAVTDESLLAVHETFLGEQPDEKARYKLLPLNLLFVFSGLIFFAGTYLNRYSGQFDPRIYNELAPPIVPEDPNKPKALTPDQLIAMGRTVYGQVCIACHQPTGQGLPPGFPPLAGSEWVLGSEDRLIRIVLHGLQGPVKVKGADYNSVMPAAGPGSGFNLNEQKIAAVLTFIRQEWGNSAPAVSEAKVREVRGQAGSKATPWTAAELEQVP